MDPYTIPKFQRTNCLTEICVPSSKSILSRVLVLAAFSHAKTDIFSSAIGKDTRTMLDCLRALGIRIEETVGCFRIHGGTVRREARIHVGNSGTCARFLPAALAFFGGKYRFDAEDQMRARPMAELFRALETCGVTFDFECERDSFPFTMHSNGISERQLHIGTDISTQFASGLSLGAAVSNTPVELYLSGSRTEGSYLKMTQDVLAQFGARTSSEHDRLKILCGIEHTDQKVAVEADLSAACYFFALALLCQTAVLVRGARRNSAQGDAQFLRLLEEKGVQFTQTDAGLIADGSTIQSFSGFDANLRDCADQALTLAALAPFATSPSRIRGIAHIRRQESDRIRAIVENLRALGVPVEEHDDGVTIYPAPIHRATIDTFGDHRVAMSFALIGAKSGLVTIKDARCVGKTFPDFFVQLDKLLL